MSTKTKQDAINACIVECKQAYDIIDEAIDAVVTELEALLNEVEENEDE